MRNWAGVLCIVSIALSSCRGYRATPVNPATATQEAVFGSLMANWLMSNYVRLSPNTEHMKELGVISLWIENISSETLMFPPNWGVKLLIWSSDDQRWEEVENLTQYGNVQDIAMPPHSFPRVVSALPNLPEREAPYWVRVVVLGELRNNSTPAVGVGGFYDIEYRP